MVRASARMAGRPRRPPPSPPALDAAWAEVEAALPRGWHLLSLSDTTGEPWSLPTWRAMAGEYGPDSPYDASVGATPAAALRALAARLAEQPKEPQP